LDSESKKNTEVGFIDVQSGKILMTIPVYEDVSGTGTLITRYSSTQNGLTYSYNSYYHLNDSSRGANIHVMNLQGSTTISSAVELSDADNNWTAAEHAASKNDMGLDVYWAQQKSYDYLNTNYDLNSFDDNGGAITSYIRYGSNNSYADNAGWSPTQHNFIFGTGYTWFKPVASLDAVAHEYGHALTTHFIGWGNDCFDEGLSDIWGAILEYRIKPNSTWKIGEQIDLSFGCLRNLQTTDDNNARMKMANTYGTTSYFDYNEADQIYYRGGVFSHWFYLLVNGGSGTNGLGNTYNVYGTRMSAAEQLIAYSVSGGYLSGIRGHRSKHN
jgi:bacillolysin